MIFRFVRIVSFVAEILGRIVMRNVSGVGSSSCCVSRLQIVSFLEPSPVHGFVAVTGNLFDVGLHVLKIEGRVLVLSRNVVDLIPHEAERQRCEGQV